MAQQLQLLIWETEVTQAGENRAVVVAKKPLFWMNVRQAARILKCSEWTVAKAYRHGKISGWKPGAIATRRDGRKSNAALRLDAGSVLAYKESVTQRGVF